MQTNEMPLQWKEGLDRYRQIRQVRERALKYQQNAKPISEITANVLRSTVFAQSDSHTLLLVVTDAQGRYLTKGDVVFRRGKLSESGQLARASGDWATAIWSSPWNRRNRTTNTSPFSILW